MPTFEYTCEECGVLFEELLLQKDDIERYREQHPCPECGRMAPREKVSLVSFNFKAPSGQTQGSGVHGQSGVHDLDYPTLDKAIGRSSSVKWKHYNERKAERDKVRKEAGTNVMSTSPDGQSVPSDAATVQLRDQAYKTFSKRPDKKPVPVKPKT